LKNFSDPTARIGVWAVSDRLRIVQSYSLDRNATAAAVHAAAGGPTELNSAADSEEKRLLAFENLGDSDTRSSTEKLWDRSPILAVNDAQRSVTEQHMPWGIASLSGNARALRALPGRKAIVYFTQVVPSDVNAADMFRSVSHSLRDASISVYVVDLNTLDTNEADGMMAAAAMGSQAASVHYNVVANDHSTAPGATTMGLTTLGFKVMNDTISTLEFDGLNANANLLVQLTQNTGGIYANPDINPRKLSRQITNGLSNYYTITYLGEDHPDGRFHSVSVKVLRPGFKADTFPGYFAVRNEAAANGNPQPFAGTSDEGDIGSLESLQAGAVDANLTLHAAMLHFGKNDLGDHSVLALEVPVKQLELRDDPNTKLSSLHATVMAEIKNDQGTTVARFHEDFRRRGSTDAAEDLRAQFLTMQRAVNLPPGNYHLEAWVRDWNADKTGKAELAVPVAEKPDTGVVSDLVLVRSTQEDSGPVQTAPLPYGNAHIIANLSGQLPKGARTASVYFQIYPGAKSTAPETMRLEVAKGGKVLASLPLHTEQSRVSAGSSRVAKVTLGSGSGTYDLTLYLESGGRTITRHLEVASEGHDSARDVKPGEELKEAKFEPPSIELDLKASSAKPLEAAQSNAFIADARERALAYGQGLPNFLCMESIDRSIDPRGTGAWKHQDSIIEMLRYADKHESRTIVEVDGRKSKLSVDGITGAYSNGEFGGVLQMIFDPAAHAEFQWQKTEEKDGQTLQEFSYAVEAKNSQFVLTAPDRTQLPAPFHGLLLIDDATHSVRRLVAQTGELPQDFGIKSSWMTIDYDYIAINGHDYLLPTSGEVGLKQGRHEAISNQLRFSNYRRFGSHARILSTGPITDEPLQ
jgi:VWFA-related protein